MLQPKSHDREYLAKLKWIITMREQAATAKSIAARYPLPKYLITFMGIDPKVHQSGSSIDHYRHISKRGSTILRTRLYNAYSVAVLRPNQFQTYLQKKRSEGKPYRVALVATMNKMARVIYAVVCFSFCPHRATLFYNKNKFYLPLEI